MRGLLSCEELDRSEIEELIAAARACARDRSPPAFRGTTVALLFLEDSLRTRVGFEVAAARLGFATTTIANAKRSAQMAVAESLEDTVRCLEPYCEVICLRHPDPDAPARVRSLVRTPIINCGNGSDEHPAQALNDLLTLDELCGRIDGLRIALVGDLRHMRSVHSLLVALAHFDSIHVRAISPDGLGMPERYARPYLQSGNTLECADSLRLEEIDVVYVAGLPQTPENAVSTADQERFRIDRSALLRVGPDVPILCPLPRVDEIAAEVDGAPNAVYFLQNALGFGMRMALLERALR